METFGIDADALRVSESDCSKSAIVTNTTQKVKRRIICMASAAQDMQIAKDPRDAACSGALSEPRPRVAVLLLARACVNFCVGKLT